MKFLHVVHGYPPNIGGIQRLFQQVSERLVGNYGDEVTVFTTTAYSNYHFWGADRRAMPAGVEIMNGVLVRRFPVFNKFGWWRLNAARLAYKFRLPYHDWLRALYNGPIIPGMTAAIAGFEADVVAASAFPLLHMQYALSGARRSGKPILFSGGLHPADAWGFDRKMIYQAIRQADGYLANTTFERDYLVERGVAAAKISVTGAGVDVDELAQADGRSWRKKHNVGDAPLVAFVGQQAEHKGIETLINSMPLVWRRRPETHLAIAGKPTAYSAKIREMAAALPPERRRQVHLLDSPADEEKNNLLAACDLLALPSRHESFGIVLVEAWACGKPVIGANIGAVAALIDADEDGLIAPAGDSAAWAQAINALLDNPDLRHRLGERGQRKVRQNYTWPAVTARFRAAYQAVLDEERRK